jgi:type VI protein secretion system component VasK
MCVVLCCVVLMYGVWCVAVLLVAIGSSVAIWLCCDVCCVVLCCVVMYGVCVAVLLVAIGSSVAIWLRRQEVEGAKAARQQEASEQPAVRVRAHTHECVHCVRCTRLLRRSPTLGAAASSPVCPPVPAA